MNDLDFNKTYRKYKLRVKIWEKEFRKSLGRIPSKYDIRDAPREIRDAYKMYYKLKTRFLEDTLTDVLSDDGFDISEMCSNDALTVNNNIKETLNDTSQLPFNITNLVNSIEKSPESTNGNLSLSNLPNFLSDTSLQIKENSENNALKQFDAIDELELNKEVWGGNVSSKVVKQDNSSTSKQKKNEKQMKSLSEKFTRKLFEGNTSFSKRNPRKALSRLCSTETSLVNESQSFNSSGSNSKDLLPDLETILIQKAKEQTEAATTASTLLNINTVKDSIKTNIDAGWLQRTSTQCNLNQIVSVKEHENEIEDKCEITAATQPSLQKSNKPTYGLSNINISTIHITAEESSIQTTDGNQQPTVEPSSLPIETTKHLISKESAEVRLGKKKIDLDNSDSVIDDSDEDAEKQTSRHRVKRRRLTSYRSNTNLVSSLELNNTKQNDLPIENSLPKENLSSKDDNDSDYTAPVSKSKSKKPAAKRKRTEINKLQTRRKNSKKTKDTNKVKDPDIDNKPKRQPNRQSKKKAKAAIANSINQTENENENDVSPPNSDDLKYNLILENANILTMPRVEPDELYLVDNLAQRYVNNLAQPAVTTIAAPTPVVNEKREAARRKLEEKIASGKLNENYRTINIQKKVFVRGKTNMNYSRYKKKMWKHKKQIAALSGPNMDMGGCDGGILKCFNCGGPGHTAQKCKLKCDPLLPLTAELLADDPSEYPTLEEAENMASQTALAVHSNNLTKLPQAANLAIYKALHRNEEELTNGGNTEENHLKTDDDDPSNSDNTELLEAANEIHLDSDSELEGKVIPIKKYVGHKIPEEFLKAAGLTNTDFSLKSDEQIASKSALYQLNTDGSVKTVTDEVMEALHLFGHTEFRKGQDRAIMRILSGMSTLVTLSTGSGKSLCYQLPAYLYARQRKCITLVISPLVSLMEDQVIGIPHFLRAHCLHTNQTQLQKLKIMEIIRKGDIDILLVSPEAVVAGERSTGFGAILRQLPPIAFACIDEAHCVSQWSHNFRPSYLMICKVLRKSLGVKCVLGLTATATLSTRSSIITHLGIPDGEKGIISDTPLPDNLILSVSKDTNRDEALLQLLLSKRFEKCHSIIVYCTRRTECERIATYLRTCFQNYKTEPTELNEATTNLNKKRNKRLNACYAEPYHAGLPASRRRTIQKAFMNNELRIVVATVAFGMGINKADIRAIIHYNMPRNFESYVQEVGRAGRDNHISHCHLFLDANGNDQNELRRHIYANSIDRHVIRKLLQNLFVECSCAKINSKNKNNNDANSCQSLCCGHEIAFSIEKTVQLLDIPEENISTLLCYMELENRRWSFNMLSNAYIKAKVISYGGAKYLKHAAKECPPLAMAIALAIKNKTFNEMDNTIEFSVVDVAAAIGWNSGVVKHQLKNLEWIQVNGHPKRSAISVNFSDLGFRLKAPGDFTTEEIDEALDSLYKRSVQQEQTQLIQLQYVFQGLSSVAYNTYLSCCKENFSTDRSDQLKAIIRNYFQNDYPKELKLEAYSSTVSDEDIINDVNGLLNLYPDNNFSGRNVARIFHGISSPNYPAIMWYRCKYWRLHFKTDFNRIVRLANTAIVQRRI